VASPAAETLQFSPVAVGAAAWELPRQVHDRWIGVVVGSYNWEAPFRPGRDEAVRNGVLTSRTAQSRMPVASCLLSSAHSYSLTFQASPR
jgi:hypothetical protein